MQLTRLPTPEQLAGNSVPKFVAAHATPAALSGQLPRWRDGICPETTGLSPGFNSFVSARIKAVAAFVEVPRKDAVHCRANIEIIFTTEPEKTIGAVSKRGSVLLGYHYAQDSEKIASFSHPIQS